MVYTVKNRIFSSNTYILSKKDSDKCIIIDPGLDPERIDEVIHLNGLRPVAILCTHGHFDHIASISYFKKKYDNLPYYLHQADAKMAKSANFFLKLAKINYWIEYIEPDYFFSQTHELLNIDSYSFSIRKMPGHSDGSCVIKYENLLFSGDIIYRRGLGFNNFPGENKDLLRESIKNIINEYDRGSMVYPGHGEAEILELILNENIELDHFINN